MKRFFLIAAILLFGLSKNFACGTINGWVEIYFKNDKFYSKKDVLMNIHCEPILTAYEKNYNGSKKENSELLLRMIKDAMSSDDQCIKDLAVKNFFVFKEMHNCCSNNEQYQQVKALIEDYLNISFDNKKATLIGASFLPYEWVDKVQYCINVRTEIDRNTR